MSVLSAAPVLRVADLSSAVQFYRKPAGGGTVYVFCEEVDEYFGKIRGRGVKVIREPGDQFYCMRDFRIHDPDGNELTFGRALCAEARAKM
jgi:hypothetical protein